MAQLLSIYHQRAPRYTLTVGDSNQVRFVCDKKMFADGKLVNVSVSGLAFEINSEHAPTMGDVIKIEFGVPGADQMASHACVTRTELTPQGQMLVGIRFERLNSSQRNFLANGLARQFEYEHFRFIRGHKTKLFIIILLFLALALSFYLISPANIPDWLTPFNRQDSKL